MLRGTEGRSYRETKRVREKTHNDNDRRGQRHRPTRMNMSRKDPFAEMFASSGDQFCTKLELIKILHCLHSRCGIKEVA